MTIKELGYRYNAYREAILYLRSNGTTVVGRKAAIDVRNEFEADLRDLVFDSALLDVQLEVR
jgi:hypothetical protein